MSIEFQGQCYLYAFQHRLSGPWTFEPELRAQLGGNGCFDYSLASLTRVDAFLDYLRQSQHPQEDSFLASPGNKHLLLLLAFYVGEIIARHKQLQVSWMRWAEFRELDNANAMFGEGFHSSFAIAEPVMYLPLVPICARLFDKKVEKSVAFSVAAQLALNSMSAEPLAAAPAKHFGIHVSYLMKEVVHWDDRQKIMTMEKPEWASKDELAKLFKNASKIFTEGRVVWAGLVQANNGLFKPYQVCAPGEVIYDPQGIAPAKTLVDIAKQLFQLKAAEPNMQSPLHPYAEHLRAETTRMFHWPIPADTVRYQLYASTTYFDCRLLPGGALACHSFPILIHDSYPGLVLPLPAALWDAKQKHAWMEILEGKARYEVLPEISKLQKNINRNQAEQKTVVKTPDTDFSGIGTNAVSTKPTALEAQEKPSFWKKILGK